MLKQLLGIDVLCIPFLGVILFGGWLIGFEATLDIMKVICIFIFVVGGGMGFTGYCFYLAGKLLGVK